MDREAWWATVHGVTKSQARLGDKHFHFTSHYIPNTSLSYIRNFIHLTPFIQFSISPVLISGDHKYSLFFYEFVCLFLMHNWPRVLCYCLVHNIVPYFCISQNNHHEKSSYHLSPYKVLLPIFLTIYISSLWLIYLATGIRTSWFPSHISLIPTSYPHPTADHLFILCICVSFLLYLHICFVF